MKHTKNLTPGFIFPLALIIITTLTIIIVNVYQRVAVAQPYTRAIIAKEKARMLALGGIEIVLQELTNLYNPQEKQEKKENEPTPSPLAELMQLVNRWHKVPLEKLYKKEEASLSYYITSNLGKINLYAIYDKEAKKYASLASGLEADKLLASLDTWGEKLVQELPSFFEKREYAPQDTTEFLELKSLKELSNSLIPEEKNNPPFFMDTFSLDAHKNGINPFLASTSLKKILGFTQEKQLDKDSEKELKDSISKIKDDTKIETIWNESLSKMDGKKWEDIPEPFKKIFTAQYWPAGFSIMVKAQVGEIHQTIYALIRAEEDTKKKLFFTDRLYWL